MNYQKPWIIHPGFLNSLHANYEWYESTNEFLEFKIRKFDLFVIRMLYCKISSYEISSIFY